MKLNDTFSVSKLEIVNKRYLKANKLQLFYLKNIFPYYQFIQFIHTPFFVFRPTADVEVFIFPQSSNGLGAVSEFCEIGFSDPFN